LLRRKGDMVSRSRGSMRPRFAKKIPYPLKKKGRRESRMRAAPAVSCAKLCKNTHTSIQVQRRQSDFPCAMVLTAASCSPRRSGFFVTVIGGVLTADLTPASRRQDHTTWPSASQAPSSLRAALRPPHPHPAYATIMIRPSDGVGWRNI
jgi:hypothetical protein